MTSAQNFYHDVIVPYKTSVAAGIIGTHTPGLHTVPVFHKPSDTEVLIGSSWSYIAATDPATVTIQLPADLADSYPGWYSAMLFPNTDHNYQRLAQKFFYVPPSSIGCFYGDGADYQGNAAVTESGRTCQDWALDTPHGHSFNHLPANYCRNPDGEPGPWCYTTDPAKRWELCDVLKCESPPPSPPSPPPAPGVPGHVDGIGIDSDTMTPTCYFPKAGWCRGFDDCSVGYAHSPAQCWNKCYHKYQDDLVAIDLDEFNTDNDCILDHSTDPPTQICHCCCQNACPSCIGAGTEALIIRADWVAEDGSTLLPASCGNPDTSAPAEYQQGSLDMANCPNHRAPQHHAIETATYDPATHSVTVTISGRDADAMHENDWCAPALAPPAARAIPVSDAALLCAQDWHLQLPDDVQLV